MSYSCSEACRIVNKRMFDERIDKQLPPQMFYNYTTSRIKKGEKPLIKCDEDGRINEESFNEWLERYVVKQVNKLNNV